MLAGTYKVVFQQMIIYSNFIISDDIQHLKDDYGITFHLLSRNPSLTYNAMPLAFQGITFEDSILTNAFHDFSVLMVDNFASVLDYLTIGGESDHYFEIHQT